MVTCTEPTFAKSAACQRGHEHLTTARELRFPITQLRYTETVLNQCAMAPGATMEVGQDGVAIITLANPPVNALHPKGTLAVVHAWLGGISNCPDIRQSNPRHLVIRVCSKHVLYSRLMVSCSAVLPLQPRKGGTQPI